MQPAPQNRTPRELIPADNYMATCYQMIYIGTVQEEYQGEQKRIPKVLLTWEIPSLMKVFKEEKGPEPLIITKEFSFSMGEKSNLRKFLANWRGKAFTNEEAAAFNIAVLLGMPCMLNVIHKTSEKSGNTYQDVGSASRFPSGIPAPSKINFASEFDVRDWNKERFDKLPEWLQNKIKGSDEYKASHEISDTPPVKQLAPETTFTNAPPNYREPTFADAPPFIDANDADDLPF